MVFGSGGGRERLGRTICNKEDLVLGLTSNNLDDMEIGLSRDDFEDLGDKR